MSDYNTFDFMVTEENDVMLLLYARNTAPENPHVRLNSAGHTVELQRNDEDTVTLQEVEDEIFENLTDEETLLVCEIAPTENDDESEIIYTYEAEIKE